MLNINADENTAKTNYLAKAKPNHVQTRNKKLESHQIFKEGRFVKLFIFCTSWLFTKFYGCCLDSLILAKVLV